MVCWGKCLTYHICIMGKVPMIPVVRFASPAPKYTGTPSAGSLCLVFINPARNYQCDTTHYRSIMYIISVLRNYTNTIFSYILDPNSRVYTRIVKRHGYTMDMVREPQLSTHAPCAPESRSDAPHDAPRRVTTLAKPVHACRVRTTTSYDKSNTSHNAKAGTAQT